MARSGRTQKSLQALAERRHHIAVVYFVAEFNLLDLVGVGSQSQCEALDCFCHQDLGTNRESNCHHARNVQGEGGTGEAGGGGEEAGHFQRRLGRRDYVIASLRAMRLCYSVASGEATM